MKKTFAAFLVALFVLNTAIGVIPAFAQEKATEYETVKTYVDVEIGTTLDAVFVCDTNGIDANKVELKDAKGKTLSTMRDLGTKGDNIKNDGVYSAKLTLSSNEPKLETYTAYVNGEAFKEYEVNFYREFTAEDEAKVQLIYDGINALEAEMEEQNASNSEIFDAVKAYLESCDEIESMEVTDVSICYTAKSGIASMYGRMSENTKGAGVATNNATAFTANGTEISLSDVKGNESLQSWTNPNVLCVRPYRNVVGEEGFHNDRHTDAAKLITKYTKGYITVLDNEETSPYRLLETFWQNGFIMIDSHGLTGFGNSYMSVWDGDGYTSGDISAHRVMRTNTVNHIWVGGSFFRYYYEKENKTLDNTFLYFGICYGMTEPSLREELFALGAVCAYGFDASVTMGYEGYNVLTMYPYLTSICETDPTRTHNLEETVAEGIRVNGPVDPYADTGAHLCMDGDTKFVVYKPDVELTGATATYETITGTVGSNCYVDVKLEPGDLVYGYSQEWTSSNPDVVEIIGARTGYCKAPGTATITGTYTYNSKTFTVSSEVTVVNVIPENIEVSVSASATKFKVGQNRDITATVYPLNAYNRNVGYISNNPGVVTVTSKGVLSSLRPGNAIIRVYSVSNPEVYTDVNIEVVTDTVYEGNNTPDTTSDFVIVTKDSTNAAVCAIQNDSYPDYLLGRLLSISNGYYGGNISAVCLWQFVKANGGYYIYNANKNQYLSMSSSEGVAITTDQPTHIFNFEENKLFVINPDNGTDTVYLRYKANRGFYFSSSGSKFELVKQVDFTSDNFATISFVDGDKTIATQVVAKGTKAVPANTLNTDANRTFLGWDKCLAKVAESFKTNALYSNEASTGILVTFIDCDGTILETITATDGKVTAPEAPVHEGKTFTGWSEALSGITYNITVFAMYSENVIGDVNADGTINTADAVVVLKFAAEMITLDANQQESANVNHDDAINTADAVVILKYVAGLITEF